MPHLDLRNLSKLNDGYETTAISVANGASFRVLTLSRTEKTRASTILYIHLHRVTLRCYIGVTVMSAGARWSDGAGYRGNSRFGPAIKKYGWDAFESYVVCFADDRDSLNRAEIQAIAHAGGHKSRYTFNLSPGGDLVAENDKPLMGIDLSTGIQREFKSGSDAARKLGLSHVDLPMAVARGDRTSAAGWWFRFADDAKAKPPTRWGDDLRLSNVRKKQGRAVLAIHYASLEQRLFSTTAQAAKALGVKQSQVSSILNDDGVSAKGWWFKSPEDLAELPNIHGQRAGRLKRDLKVFGVNLTDGSKRSFRNCTVADVELSLHKGASAAVAAGKRTSSGGWWFSYEEHKNQPELHGNALVAKARSKAVIATNSISGKSIQYESAKVAAEKLGMSRAAISKSIKSGSKPAKGYSFKLAY